MTHASLSSHPDVVVWLSKCGCRLVFLFSSCDCCILLWICCALFQKLALIHVMKSQHVHVRQLGNCYVVQCRDNVRGMRCILGPHFPIIGVLVCVFLLLLLLLRVVLNSDTVISPTIYTWTTYFLGSAAILLSLILGLHSDPGIVSVSLSSEKGMAIEHIENQGDEQKTSVTTSVLWRYCDICDVEHQDDSVVHCPSCDCCIHGYHHHCSWLGKCIGQGNWTLYMVFISVCGLFLAFTGVVLSRHILLQGRL